MDLTNEILYHATKNLFGRLRICLRAICCIPIDLIIPAEFKTPIIRRTTGTLVVKRTKKLHFHITPKPQQISSKIRSELGTGELVQRRMDIEKRKKVRKCKGCPLFKRHSRRCNEIVPKRSIKALKWHRKAFFSDKKCKLKEIKAQDLLKVENNDKKWESLVVLNKIEVADNTEFIKKVTSNL